MNNFKSKLERKLWWLLKMDERLKGWDDARYLRLLYRIRIGRPLTWTTRRPFNEKLQWLKLHDRNPLYTKLVDKAEVKPWVAERIGWEHVVPTLGVWDTFDEIDFGALPGSLRAQVHPRLGRSRHLPRPVRFRRRRRAAKIERSLASNYFWSGRSGPTRT